MRIGTMKWMWWVLPGLLPAGLLVAAQSDEELIERGRYLATTVAGCYQCHTPRQDGKLMQERSFSGHAQGSPAPVWEPSMEDKNIELVVAPSGTAFSGPWGTSFSSNLTPDPSTGLGAWNEGLFIRTMRRGDYRPPMPVHLKDLSRNDLRAIWRYLQTLEPIHNPVPRFRARE